MPDVSLDNQLLIKNIGFETKNFKEIILKCITTQKSIVYYSKVCVNYELALILKKTAYVFLSYHVMIELSFSTSTVPFATVAMAIDLSWLLRDCDVVRARRLLKLKSIPWSQFLNIIIWKNIVFMQRQIDLIYMAEFNPWITDIDYSSIFFLSLTLMHS